jgi:hypothetical protein
MALRASISAAIFRSKPVHEEQECNSKVEERQEVNSMFLNPFAFAAVASGLKYCQY